MTLDCFALIPRVLCGPGGHDKTTDSSQTALRSGRESSTALRRSRPGGQLRRVRPPPRTASLRRSGLTTANSRRLNCFAEPLAVFIQLGVDYFVPISAMYCHADRHFVVCFRPRCLNSNALRMYDHSIFMVLTGFH